MQHPHTLSAFPSTTQTHELINNLSNIIDLSKDTSTPGGIPLGCLEIHYTRLQNLISNFQQSTVRMNDVAPHTDTRANLLFDSFLRYGSTNHLPIRSNLLFCHAQFDGFNSSSTTRVDFSVVLI